MGGRGDRNRVAITAQTRSDPEDMDILDRLRVLASTVLEGYGICHLVSLPESEVPLAILRKLNKFLRHHYKIFEIGDRKRFIQMHASCSSFIDNIGLILRGRQGLLESTISLNTRAFGGLI